jgi:hypothetical protein
MSELELVDVAIDISGRTERLSALYALDSPAVDETRVVISGVASGGVETFADVAGTWRRVSYLRRSSLTGVAGAHVPEGAIEVRIPPRSQLIRVTALLAPGDSDSDGSRLWEPTTRLEFAEFGDLWPDSVTIHLGEHLLSEKVGVWAAPKVQPELAKIEAILEATRRESLSSAVVERLLDDVDAISPKLVRLANSLTTEFPTLDYAEGHSPELLAKQVEIVKARLHDVRAQFLEGRDLRQISAVLGDVKAILSGLPSVGWVSSSSRIDLPATSDMSLQLVVVPVSPDFTNANRSDGRVGTPLALMTMAMILGAIAWRMNGPWLVESLSQSAREWRVARSREPLVAILLVFPALLLTQIDKGPSGRFPPRVGAASVSAGLNLVLFVPMLLSVVVLAEPRPTLLTGSLLGAMVLLLFVAVFASFFTSGSNVRRSHERLARRIS